MNTFKQDKELISAYLDGELSPKEKEYIEGKISSSLELQKQLADIKRLKELTAESFERIPESPYFQTRLNAELNSSKPLISSIKRWLPAMGLVIITIALMVTLKFYPDLVKDLIEEQKSNLASLYKENLQPLLFAADLTNEDIFNFAFKSELPLDKTDQNILRLGYDTSGKEFFEIKKAALTIEENNLEKFVRALNLDDDQRKEMDSIIASYSDELIAQILINDKNTVAISPNLWNYQKAIAAELLAFAKSKNAYVYNSIVPPKVPANEYLHLAQYVKDSNTSRENKYIFFTPDTIFTDTFEFDNKAFKEEMIEMEKDLEEMNRNISRINFRMQFDSTFKRLENDSLWAKDFSVKIDSNHFRVNIPRIVMHNPNGNLPDMDSINKVIGDALKNVEVYVKRLPERTMMQRKFKVEVQGSDSTILRQFGFDNVDSLMKKFYIHPDSMNNFNFDNFNFYKNDSLFFNHNEELRKQMNELKEEMRKFREEMRNFKNSPPDIPDTSKTKLKGIEI